jgi:hypothetical protein
MNTLHQSTTRLDGQLHLIPRRQMVQMVICRHYILTELDPREQINSNVHNCHEHVMRLLHDTTHDHVNE